MDIPRPDQARKKRRRRILYVSISLLVLTLITVGLMRLEPALPTVDAPYKDTVKRGEFLRQVRGNGTLIPEEIRWIPAQNAGRVTRIFVLQGAAVKADTIIVELSNPELEQSTFDAEWALKAAKAELANLRVQLSSQKLTQKGLVATAEANYNNAELEAEVNTELSKNGLVPALTLKQSKARAMELGKLAEIERERLQIGEEATSAQMMAQQAKVEQLTAQLELKKQLVESLKIRAGIDGVLQRLGDLIQLQEGQQIPQGANVARVANPLKLKAEIKIAEVQAKDIELGQSAVVDTRNGTIAGTVVRIDPSAQNGTRAVDVKLEGALPRGAVPDLSVEGTVQLERLENVMYVGRPIHGEADSTIGLFKVLEGGKTAMRVPVKLGRTSVSYVEVVEGLQVGDTIILSDMSNWDAHEKVRLN